MANKSKYVFLTGNVNFLDFYLDQPDITVSNQEITIIGSSSIDAIFLRLGVSINFTGSGGGADKVYVENNYADYTFSINGSTLFMSRSQNSLSESIYLSINTPLASDVIVFRDGYLSTYEIRNILNNHLTPSLNTTEKSGSPQIAIDKITSSISAVAIDPTVFTLVYPNQKTIFTGSSGVDAVYVRPGSNIDASNLGGGNDLIYFSARWEDYHKYLSGTQLILSRQNILNNLNETVIVSANNGSLNDKLIFSNGKIFSNDAKNTIRQAELSKLNIDSILIQDITGFDAQTKSLGMERIVSISADKTVLKKNQTSLINIQFLDDPSTKINSDTLKVSGGIVSPLISTNNSKIWQTTFTPTNNILNGQASISIDPFIYYDTDGKSVSMVINYDTLSVTSSIQTISTDNIINNSELNNLSISGEAPLNSKIELIFNGYKIEPVLSGNDWTYNLNQTDISHLSEGLNTLTLLATDNSNNISSAIKTITIDTIASTIIVGDIATDNIINSNEYNCIISGTLSETSVLVDLIIASNTIHTFVSGTNWSYTFKSTDIVSMGQGNEIITIQAQDQAGNISTLTKSIVVDTIAPFASINTIADDDIINSSEQVILTGTVENQSDVKVVMGSNQNSATVIGTDWSYHLTDSDITTLGEDAQTISILATDNSGNIKLVTRVVQIDTILPVVSIDIIASDNAINNSEQHSIISGLTEQGTTVQLILANNTQNLTLNSTKWSYTLTQSDMTSMGQGSEIISIRTTDSAGNISIATTTIMIDTILPTISIQNIATDNIINSYEVGTVITGVTPETSASSIHLIFGSNTGHVAQLSKGNWTYTLSLADIVSMGQGEEIITAEITDSVGNIGKATRTIIIDTIAPNLSIHPISGDNRINSSDNDIVISGIVESDAKVNLNLGTAVKSINVIGTTWQYTLSTTDMNALGQGQVNLTAHATDLNSNITSITTSVEIDTITPLISINVIADDDKINGDEIPTVIKGSTENGSQVQLILGSLTRTAILNQTNWTYTLTPLDIATIGQGATIISATSTDGAGNIGTATRSILIDTIAPSIGIDTVAGDDVINSQELQTILTGSLSETNCQVSLSIDQQQRTASVFEKTWRYTLSPSDLVTVSQGVLQIAVIATDSAGNVGQSTRQIQLDSNLPIVSINTIAGDNIINKIEQQNVILSGIAELDSQPVLLFTGTQHSPIFTGTNWTYTLKPAEIAAMGQGSEIIKVQTRDDNGNLGEATITIMVDTIAPTQSATIQSISDNEGAQTGTVLSGTKTDDTTLTLAGTISSTLSQGHVVAIYDHFGQVITRLGTASINGSNWTFESPTLALSPTTQTLIQSDQVLFHAPSNAFYKLISQTNAMTWEDANNEANKILLFGVPGHLVQIDNSIENTYLNETVSHHQRVWIGASDKQTEGEWKWYAGASTSQNFWLGDGATGSAQHQLFNNWAPNEPNNGGTSSDQDYGLMKEDGTWVDLSGTLTANDPTFPTAYIIEWDATMVLAHHFQSIVEDLAGNQGPVINTYNVIIETLTSSSNTSSIVNNQSIL